MKSHSCIILMGMKHTGKSTLGTILAKELSYPFYDTDEVITLLSGKTARELYDAGGAALMKQWETAAFRYIFDLTRNGSGIIASGGGLADNSEALALCRDNGLCVYLDTPEEILFERICQSAKRDGRLPPFLQGDDPHALFLELYARRSATYATMAHVHIQAGNKKPLEISREITDYIQYEQRTNFHSRR